MTGFRPPALALLGALALLAAGGCVRRTITITSEPPGALVWLNDREIGRTPVEVDFDFYGTYDVRLVKAGYEPLLTSGKANSPWWDTLLLDLVAELVPADLHARLDWHYVLQPRDDDPEALRVRAAAIRSELTEAEAGGERPAADEGEPQREGRLDD